MNLGICSLASSSSGNCYLIKGDNETILLDVGISTKRIKENLGIKGIDLSEVDAILVTHEHVDHVKSLKTLLRKADKAKVFASKGTYDGIKEKYEDISIELSIIDSSRVNLAVPGEPFDIGKVRVTPFNVSHDTNEPVAFSFGINDGGYEKKISVVTDTGYITEEIYEAIKGSDILIIESNHEPDILMYGRYPYPVKKRILSDYGHLSNESCAKCLVRLLKDRKARFGGTCEDEFGKIPRVFLAHLSTENNTPEQAILTVSNLLEEEGYYVGKDLTLETLRKDEASKLLFV